MRTKTIKIRIKDSKAKAILKEMAFACNFVWNYCNETSFDGIRNKNQWLSSFDLQKLTKGSSKELGVSACSIQEICSEYAFRRTKSKKRKLRWRSKKSLGWIPFKKNGIKFKHGKVKYFGHEFSLFQPDRMPTEDKLGAGEFCQDARGRWYFCISVKFIAEETKSIGEVGIDLGIKTLATLSDGQKVKNGQYYRIMEGKLKNAQRKKRTKIVKNIHAKIKNRRYDDLHKASTKIVSENKLIVVGKLGVKKLEKTKMAKSIKDAGTSMFRKMLRYKASARGCIYVEVNEANTTRTCSSCGAIPASAPQGLKGLSIREWVCCDCFASHDRDINAAMNILRIGRYALVPKVA